jgi:hypothetical protein
MTTARLITYLTALPDYAVRSMPMAERVALARECLRLLRAVELAAPPPKAGVLAELRDRQT